MLGFLDRLCKLHRHVCIDHLLPGVSLRGLCQRVFHFCVGHVVAIDYRAEHRTHTYESTAVVVTNERAWTAPAAVVPLLLDNFSVRVLPL